MTFGQSFAMGDITGDGHLDLALGAQWSDLNNGSAWVADLSSVLWPFAEYQAQGPLVAPPTIRLTGSGVPRPAGTAKVLARNLPDHSLAFLATGSDYAAINLVPPQDPRYRDLSPDPYQLVAPPLTWQVLKEPLVGGAAGKRSHARQKTYHIPNDPSLLGLRFRMQAFAFDAKDNILAVSNGLVMTIQNWPQ